MKEEIILGYKNLKLTTYLWDNVQSPIGVVQIIHGMQEHATRYNDFAKFLNKHNYIVFASDLRGHGKTAENVKLQGYSKGDIFNEIVKDQLIIADKLKEKYNLPLYVIGHSFGSFITQRLIQATNLYEKAILCGTAYTKTVLNYIGKCVVNVMSIFKNDKSPAKLIENMSFGNYAKKFKNGNWLCSDEEIYKQYKNDIYCGQPFPISFYKSALKNMFHNYKNLNLISHKIKILIISGLDDPIGNYGKLIKKLDNIYKKHNIKSEYKLYKNGRHEILNETFKQNVYDDILNFLK